MQLSELTRFLDDVEAATAFYRTLTGSEPDSAWPGGAVFDLGGPTLLLYGTVEHDEPPGEDHLAFAVVDVDAACERLDNHGVPIEWPPADYDWGRSAPLRDPAGNLVELIETERRVTARTAPSAARPRTATSGGPCGRRSSRRRP